MRHMKTERENYLKPQTIMEQVAMEQGICAASVVLDDTRGLEAKGHEVGNTYTFENNGSGSGSEFSMTWD